MKDDKLIKNIITIMSQIATLQSQLNLAMVEYLATIDSTDETPVPDSNMPATSPFSSNAFGSAPPVEPSPTPVFAAPPFAAQDPHPIPFSNSQELMDYVMGVYSQSQDQMKTGAAIQGVLKDLGALQLSDIEPERYALLFQRIEALK